MEQFLNADFWLAVGQIIMIDILLGGDNAVVIALACRKLPAAQRKLGILWGTAGAIVLRVALIFFALTLLQVPFLKLVGAALLLWIGVKLLLPEHGDGHADIQGSDRLWAAVKTVIVADFVMSLDNVIAIAGAAEAAGEGNEMVLVVFGLLVSIPIIVWGSQMVIKLMDRFPVIITLGGILLGWIAGTMAIGDPAIAELLPVESDGTNKPPHASRLLEYAAGTIGALAVLLTGRCSAHARPPAQTHEHRAGPPQASSLPLGGTGRRPKGVPMSTDAPGFWKRLLGSRSTPAPAPAPAPPRRAGALPAGARAGPRFHGRRAPGDRPADRPVGGAEDAGPAARILGRRPGRRAPALHARSPRGRPPAATRTSCRSSTPARPARTPGSSWNTCRVRDLSHFTRPGTLLPAAEVLRLVIRLARALDHAHRQGVVHRDIKPANVMLDRAGWPAQGDGLRHRPDRRTAAAPGPAWCWERRPSCRPSNSPA